MNTLGVRDWRTPKVFEAKKKPQKPEIIILVILRKNDSAGKITRVNMAAQHSYDCVVIVQECLDSNKPLT